VRIGVAQKLRKRETPGAKSRPACPESGGADRCLLNLAGIDAEDLGGLCLVVGAGAQHQVGVLLALAGQVFLEAGPILDLTTRASVVAAIFETTWLSSERLPGQW
jgi:hypothetical protein